MASFRVDKDTGGRIGPHITSFFDDTLGPGTLRQVWALIDVTKYRIVGRRRRSCCLAVHSARSKALTLLLGMHGNDSGKVLGRKKPSRETRTMSRMRLQQQQVNYNPLFVVLCLAAETLCKFGSFQSQERETVIDLFLTCARLVWVSMQRSVRYLHEFPSQQIPIHDCHSHKQKSFVTTGKAI